MKVKFTKHFPPGNFRAINLFGTLFYKGEPPVSRRTLNHEGTHTEQMKELLWVGFYILYGIEWLIRLFTDWGRAYRRISFEQEAYTNQSNDSYNSTRERFAWTKYLWWNEDKGVR